MAFTPGPVGLPNITPAPIVPFQNGFPNNQHFQTTPPLGGQQFPWQQNQQKDRLWQTIQQNRQNIDKPFNFQQTTQTPTTQFPWQQQNQSTFSQQASTTNTGGGTNGNPTWYEEWLNKNQNNTSNSFEESAGQDSQTSQEESGQESQSSQEESEKSSSKEKEDEEAEKALEEMQEKAEEWFDNMTEEKEELYEDFELYTLLLFPFLIYERTTANYFAATELLSTVLTKLGVNDEDNTVLLLFIQCVDIVALSRGRFKFVEGYKANWYQELYDYTLTRMGAPNPLRVGTQMLMPQSPAPEYEER